MYLSRPSLGQVADDNDLLGRCEGPDHFTNLEDEFFAETSFIVGIISKFTAASRQVQKAWKMTKSSRLTA